MEHTFTEHPFTQQAHFSSSETDAARIDASAVMYKTFSDTAETVLARRAEANRFYLTLNMGIIGAGGFLFREPLTASETLSMPAPLMWLAAIFSFAGLVVSWNWLNIIRSHRSILTTKFLVLHAMERKLPLTPFITEYTAAKQTGRSSVGQFELRLPGLFMTFYILALTALFWVGIFDPLMSSPVDAYYP